MRYFIFSIRNHRCGLGKYRPELFPRNQCIVCDLRLSNASSDCVNSSYAIIYEIYRSMCSRKRLNYTFRSYDSLWWLKFVCCLLVDQVSVSHPHLSQALLASGSQTPQQQPQPQPQQLQCIQVVAKEDNRSGTTSSSIIKSLLATKVTVSSDCMPSAAATCVSTPTACVTNTTASIASSISANQLITSNQVSLLYINKNKQFVFREFFF